MGVIRNILSGTETKRYDDTVADRLDPTSTSEGITGAEFVDAPVPTAVNSKRSRAGNRAVLRREDGISHANHFERDEVTGRPTFFRVAEDVARLRLNKASRSDYTRDVLFGDISSRGFLFRRRLVDEFRIGEAITAGDGSDAQTGGGSSKVVATADAPILSTKDIENDPLGFKKLLRDNPSQPIKFKRFSRLDVGSGVDLDSFGRHAHVRKLLDKRLVRIANLRTIPVGVWASWMVTHDRFQTLIMVMILVNAILLGIEAELDPEDDFRVIQAFDIVDLITLMVFALEIGLKWIDSFKGFWNDYWNILDFVVTALSAVPVFGGSDSLRVYRILRTVKLILRFRSLKLIVITIFEAFQSMSSIVVLLALMFYIFAIIGINVFEEYTFSARTDLLYQDRFETLSNAFITLFQLLTLDQWYFIREDYARVIGSAVTNTYFVVWVFLAAFVFRNVFVGVMVKFFEVLQVQRQKDKEELITIQRLEAMKRNLQKARAERDVEAEAERSANRSHGMKGSISGASNVGAMGAQGADDEKERKGSKSRPQLMGSELSTANVLAARLQTAAGPASTSLAGETGFLPPQLLEQLATGMASIGSNGIRITGTDLVLATKGASRVVDDLLTASEQGSFRWSEDVVTNLQGLLTLESETMWPRDTLFKYLRAMETMQENLREFHELQHLAAMSISIMLESR